MKIFSTLLTVSVLACCIRANAQCDKPFILTSSQTLYLDSNNQVVRTEDEISTIGISKTEITIKPGENNIMKGPVSDHACNWKTPYKEGRSVIRGSISNEAGESRSITLTIEGKNGIVTCLGIMDNDPNKKVKLVATKFE